MNKKSMTSSGLTAEFKFPGHPQKLVQSNNWFSMIYIFVSWKKFQTIGVFFGAVKRKNGAVFQNFFEMVNLYEILYCAASIKICFNECGCPCLWETWLRNLNLVWHLADEILKRFFFKIRKHWISLTKKNVMVLKFCTDLDISTADGNLIKVIKKYEGRKAHAEDRTQTSSGITAKFKFLSQDSHKQTPTSMC